MDLKARLASGYSQSSSIYDDVAGALYLRGLHRLLPLVSTPPWPAILDVGSGTGLNLLEAARCLGPCRLLAGVDIAPGMVAVAQAKANALGIPAVFHLADAEALPFADQTFDLVICNSVYHWFRDRLQAVREMRRVLRSGGQLLLICAARSGYAEWFYLVENILRILTGKPVPPVMPLLPDLYDLSTDLTAAGLDVQHLQHHRQPVQVVHPEGFVQFMNTVAPHWQADLPVATRQRVNTAAAELIAAAPGGFSCTWAALEALASRR